MAVEGTTSQTSKNALDALGTDYTQGTQGSKVEKKIAGKTEFLTLLVTQLKNQDPLNPMENQEFAVQLAQFSSLEQLIDINGKLTSGGSDSSSMAGYLGRLITTNSDKVSVDNHDGGYLRLTVPHDATELTLQLTNADGVVIEESTLGPVEAGKHDVALTDLNIRSGDYSYKVTGLGTDGQPFNVTAKAAGVVSGFVPGANPSLLVGNKEVSLSEVTEVSVLKGAA